MRNLIDHDTEHERDGDARTYPLHDAPHEQHRKRWRRGTQQRAGKKEQYRANEEAAQREARFQEWEGGDHDREHK